MMAIPKGHAQNLETIKRVADERHLGLIEATDTVTGEKVTLLMACVQDIATGEYVVTPLAQMLDGDPYERFIPPEGAKA